jgi:hypothetical protein
MEPLELVEEVHSIVEAMEVMVLRLLVEQEEQTLVVEVVVVPTKMEPVAQEVLA